VERTVPAASHRLVVLLPSLQILDPAGPLRVLVHPYQPAGKQADFSDKLPSIVSVAQNHPMSMGNRSVSSDSPTPADWLKARVLD